MFLLSSPRKQSGFTLIELMIVMAIVAILAMAGLTAYTGYIKGARDTNRVAIANQMKTIAEAQTTISGAPTPAEFEAYLLAEGIAWNISTEEPLLARVVGSLAGVFGISDALALIEDPVGGRAVCLDHEGNAKIVCQFVYYRFSDGTYAISYGVEKAANLVNAHYSSETGDGPRTYGSFIGNNSAITANPATPTTDIEDEEVLTVPNITVASTALSDTHEYINVFTCGGATCGAGQSCVSEVCTDLCGGDVCTESQSCVSEVCTDLCGGQVCTVDQSCVSNVCTDLCGGQVCTGQQTCVSNVCTDPDVCTVGTPTIGMTCSDGTKYVNASLRAIPSSAGTYQWVAAVSYCDGLTANTHADWHLPTKTELDVLYANKVALSTGTGYHWSSVEYDATHAWAKDFSNGIWYYDWTVKTAGFAVRCVRIP